MGNSFPWTRTSIVRHILNVHPHFNAYAFEQLMLRYNVKLCFSNRRVYLSGYGMEVSHVLPTLVIGDVEALLSYVEGLLKLMRDE